MYSAKLSVSCGRRYAVNLARICGFSAGGIRGAQLSCATADRGAAERASRAMSVFMLSNGEVDGPDDHVGQATRAHTVFPRPRRQTAHVSRPPPTIVRVLELNQVLCSPARPSRH